RQQEANEKRNPRATRASGNKQQQRERHDATDRCADRNNDFGANKVNQGEAKSTLVYEQRELPTECCAGGGSDNRWTGQWVLKYRLDNAPRHRERRANAEGSEQTPQAKRKKHRARLFAIKATAPNEQTKRADDH